MNRSSVFLLKVTIPARIHEVIKKICVSKRCRNAAIFALALDLLFAKSVTSKMRVNGQLSSLK